MSLPSNSAARSPQAPGSNASLDDWLTYLEALHPTEIDLGLDRVLVVLRRLFRSNPTARIITVGGTNGKGSAVAALEKLLISAGRTTAAYTSPHLQDYNERARINGLNATDEMFVRAFEAVERARGKTTLTYFEFGTLAAFVLFQEAGVDDWILEVGLGGRLDAVNVLDPDLVIITSVDIDHIAFLGDNREIIGFEKAGILRPGIPVVYADDNPPDSVLQQAAAQKVQLVRPGAGYDIKPGVDDSKQLVMTANPEPVSLSDQGLPVNSLAAAVVAMRTLEPEVTVAQIEASLAGLSLPGRFERLQDIPTVIADVGHNPHAAAWLANRVCSIRRPGQKVLAVYGALADKDVEGVMKAMSDQVDQWFMATLNVPRGLTSEELMKRTRELSPNLDQSGFGSVEQALDAALSRANTRDLVLVFGSFFTVAGARQALGHQPS